MRPVNFRTFCEEGADPADPSTARPPKQFAGWTPERVRWWTGYAANHLFKTPEEARRWVFDRLQHFDRDANANLFGGPNGEEYNRVASNAMPVYTSGKSVKLGKKVHKDYRLKWEQVRMKTPDWEQVVQTAQACDTREFRVHKTQLVPIRKLLGDDSGDAYGHGRELEWVRELARQIKTNLWFEPILYDFNDVYIMEGQHRVRAARLLGFATVPGMGIEYLN